MKRCMPLALAHLTGNLLFASDAMALNQDKSALDLHFGGDIRLRYDATNNLPNEKHGKKLTVIICGCGRACGVRQR